MPGIVFSQPPGSLSNGQAPDLGVATARAERSLSQPGLRDMALLGDLGGLRRASMAAPATLARADALIAEASALAMAGHSEGFRTRASEAAALMLGRPWTPQAAYAASLGLDVTELIADAGMPLHARLTQLFPAALPGDGVTVRLSLVTYDAERQPGAPRPETLVRPLWTMAVPAAGFVARPIPFDVDLQGVPDGSYALRGEILLNGAAIGVVRSQVRIVTGLLTAEQQARATLKQHPVRDSLAATILYPFDTARAVNGWRREAPENLDWTASLERSRALLGQAAQGRDPLWQATGDMNRAYFFKAGRETMPYRLYVPSDWRPGQKWPVVLLLHGGGSNEDAVMPRTGRFAGLVQKLADRHRMIVVAPLGYRPSGGYGAVYGLTSAGRESVRPDVAPDQTGPTLSEADTMAVLEQVRAEYGADPDRIYVMGNSMGGGGTWHLAARYPDIFAAASPNGSSLGFESYDFGALARMPIRIVVGGRDAEQRRALAAQAAKALSDRGYDATLTVVPNEDHSNAWLANLPETFAFLAAQRRHETR